MSPTRLFFRYGRDLKTRSRNLRHDPTPAERKLWFDFLATYPHKFTRQKPLGRYIADFYCASARLAIELDGDSHFSEQVMDDFEAVCARLDEAVAASSS